MKKLIQPLPVRIFHWVMVVSVLLLTGTGIMFSLPHHFLILPYRLLRLIHGTAGIILTANTFGQIYYYLVTRRYPEVLLNLDDWRNLGAFLQYYVFLRPSHPNFGRYNPGQKLIYDSWILLIVLSAVAGFILMFPADSTAWQVWLGGMQQLRLVKYFITIWFIATIPVHIYLVFTEDPAKLQAMITGYVSKEAAPPAVEAKPVKLP